VVRASSGSFFSGDGTWQAPLLPAKPPALCAVLSKPPHLSSFDPHECQSPHAVGCGFPPLRCSCCQVASWCCPNCPKRGLHQSCWSACWRHGHAINAEPSACAASSSLKIGPTAANSVVNVSAMGSCSNVQWGNADRLPCMSLKHPVFAVGFSSKM